MSLSSRRVGTALQTAVMTAALLATVGVSIPDAAAETEAPARPPAANEDLESGGACGVAPGVVGGVCDAVGDVVGGGIGAVVGGGTDAVLTSMVDFVVDGAGWLLEQLTTFMDTSTRPDLRAGWFRDAYRDMAVIGMLGMLPFLLLALIQAVLRQDIGLMLRTTFGYVPLAAIGTAGAIVVVDLLVQLTDELSAWIGRGLGSDLDAFATGVGTAMARTAPPAGTVVAGLAALLGAAVVAFAAFVIWLELLLRQAAIYVAVLFFPLGFMAMVWPATAHWVRRLVQGLVAIILSKFVIVAVMALAASAIDADVADEGFAVVVSGGSLLTLAALAPYVLLRLIPVFDAGMSGELEGTFRRPTAAVGAPVTGGQMVGLMHQRVGGRTAPAHGGGTTAAGTSAAVGGGSAATGSPAGGITALAGAAAARGARATSDRAEQAADVATQDQSVGRREGP